MHRIDDLDIVGCLEKVHQLGMVTHTCNASMWEVKAGGLGVQSQPWLHETLSQKSNRNEDKGKIQEILRLRTVA